MRLVILPQLAGSEALLAPFLDALRDHGIEPTVIEPPGFASGAQVPKGLPSTRKLARAVVRDWADRGIERASVFGISLGGMVAQHVAHYAVDRIDRLVLASTAARGLRAVLAADLREAALARCLIEPGSEAVVALAHEVIGDKIDEDDALREHVDQTIREQAPSKSEVLWLAAAAARHDARKRLASVDRDALILIGSDDHLMPLDAQLDLAKRLPRAQHEVLEGLGHDLTLEDPARTAEAVARFLG